MNWVSVIANSILKYHKTKKYCQFWSEFVKMKLTVDIELILKMIRVSGRMFQLFIIQVFGRTSFVVCTEFDIYSQ